MSFFEGNFINILKILLFEPINKFFIPYFKKTFSFDRRKYGYLKSFAGNILSGSLAGVCSLLMIYPLEFARTLLINDIGHKKFKGIFDVFSKTVQKDGIQGLYKGFTISCIGFIVYRTLYIGISDLITAILPNNIEKTHFYICSIGMISMILSRVIAYPLYTIQKRMMLKSGEFKQFNGFLDCFINIQKEEGFIALLAGAGIHITLSGMMDIIAYYILY